MIETRTQESETHSMLHEVHAFLHRKRIKNAMLQREVEMLRDILGSKQDTIAHLQKENAWQKSVIEAQKTLIVQWRERYHAKFKNT